MAETRRNRWFWHPSLGIPHPQLQVARCQAHWIHRISAPWGWAEIPLHRKCWIRKKGRCFHVQNPSPQFLSAGGLLILHERELRSKTVLSQIGSIDTIAQQSRPLYLVLFRTPSILVKKNWPLHLCEVDYGARSVPGVPGVPALVRCPVVTVNNFVQVPWGPWMSMGNFCIFQAQSHRTMDTMS